MKSFSSHWLMNITRRIFAVVLGALAVSGLDCKDDNPADPCNTCGDYRLPCRVTTAQEVQNDALAAIPDPDGYDLRIEEVRGSGNQLLRVQHVESNFVGSIELPRGGSWILTLEDIDTTCAVTGANPLEGVVGPEVPQPDSVIWNVVCQ